MGREETGVPRFIDLRKACGVRRPREHDGLRQRQARRLFRDALARVMYFPPYPRFICDVILDGRVVGSFAEDAKGIVTFDETGTRFGRRKQLRRAAIEAIVSRALS